VQTVGLRKVRAFQVPKRFTPETWVRSDHGKIHLGADQSSTSGKTDID
jgi:hypothetical protein